MKRITVLVAIAVFAILAPVHAQSVSVGTFTKYMTPHGVILYDRPSVQADATWNLPQGTYLDLWADQSVDGKNNEIDYTLGWGNKYVNANFAYYDLNPIGKSGDMFMSDVSVGVPKKVGGHSTRIYGEVNYLSPRQDLGGMWLRVGASDNWPIGGKATANQLIWIMHDGGAFGGPRGYLVHYEASVLLARHFQPIVKFSVPLQRMVGRERQVIFGLIVNR
jgi:hypothetical protein